MLSDRSLGALRCAAAVVTAAPGVRVAVMGGERTVLQVATPPFDGLEGQVVAACRFHGAVARAYRQHEAGHRLGLSGLDETLQPAVRYGVRAGELASGPGLLRLDCGGRWLHLVALAACGPGIDEILSQRVDAGGFSVEVAGHVDEELGTTIAHVATHAGDDTRSAAAFDALISIMGRVLVSGTEAHLCSAAT